MPSPPCPILAEYFRPWCPLHAQTHGFWEFPTSAIASDAKTFQRREGTTAIADTVSNEAICWARLQFFLAHRSCVTSSLDLRLATLSGSQGTTLILLDDPTVHFIYSQIKGASRLASQVFLCHFFRAMY